MKRLICIILAVFLLLCCCSCTKRHSVEVPIRFYYRTAEQNYDKGSSVIVAEVREAKDLQTLEQALRLYLQGPEDKAFLSPFGEHAKLVSATIEGDTVVIVMNETFTGLTGLDLTIACACLTLTCLGITDAVQVDIRAENGLLNGAKSITMNRDCLLLIDNGAEMLPPEE